MYLLMGTFDAEMARVGPMARLSAISIAFVMSSASSTTKLTSPRRSASSAGRRSPVIMKYLARLTPMSSGQITCPPSPAPIPMRTWVSANVALRAATTMSANNAKFAPSPMA